MNPFWVVTDADIRLAIVPRPRGGDWLEGEVTQMKAAGVDVLVSLLQPDEAAELGLADEAAICAAGGIAFRSYPIPDREAPISTVAFAQFVEQLRREAHSGRSVAVHCRASIGRSSVLLAALLALEGCAPDDAFRRLSKARGLQVPDTGDQIRWVERFAAAHRT